MADDKIHATETSTEAGSSDESSSRPERICPKCERSFGESVTRCPDHDVLLIIVGDDVDPLIGKTIRDTLTLRERVGKGGMGVVYTAWQHSVGREVAVKVMNSRINRDADAAKRFIREANLASQLSHPNIVTIHDFGQDEDRLLYIVMEFLTGVSLREALRDGETFDLEQVHRIVSQLCDALEAAHDATIVHRDLKPANIMLLRKPGVRDFLKVLDFGIAKSLDGQHTTITQSNAILGTPAYMPPEVALNGTFDARSDLYSLGVIAYQLLAGRLPFEADDVRAMVGMHAAEPVPSLPEAIPPAISTVIQRLLRKEPAARYQSAAQVRDAFNSAMRSGPARQLAQRAAERLDDSLHPTLPATPGALVRTDVVDVTAGTRVDRPNPPADPAGGLGRSRWPLASAALLVVGVAVFLILRGLGDDAPPSTADTPKPVAVSPLGGEDAMPETAVVQPSDAGSTVDAAPSTVRVTVKARDAVVFINGKPYGKGPVQARLPRSDSAYYVRVRRDGYKEWTGSYAADRDRVVAPTLVPVRSRRIKPKPSGDKAGPPPDANDPWLVPKN